MLNQDKKTKSFNLKDFVENKIIYCERKRLEDKEEDENYPQYDKGEIDSYRKILTLINNENSLDVFWDKNYTMNNKLLEILDSDCFEEDDFDYYDDGGYMAGYSRAIIDTLSCIEPSYSDEAYDAFEEKRIIKPREKNIRVDEINLQMIIEKKIRYNEDKGENDALIYILSKINNTSIKEFEEIVKEKALEVLKQFDKNIHMDEKHLEYLYDYYNGLVLVLSLINESVADELCIAINKCQEEIDVVVKRINNLR